MRSLSALSSNCSWLQVTSCGLALPSRTNRIHSNKGVNKNSGDAVIVKVCVLIVAHAFLQSDDLQRLPQEYHGAPLWLARAAAEPDVPVVLLGHSEIPCWLDLM